MKHFYSVLFCIFMFSLSTLAQQQDFVRSHQIPPFYGLYGGIISGVDWDGDGKVEIYAVNSNAVDRDFELVPRIWKYEFNGTSWDSVWGAVMDIPFQNTWPAFTSGDLDGDGKMELLWGPVNFLDATSNPNPARVIVFEVKGDGSDILGVDDGFGGYLPNSTFTITDQDNFNLRPRRFVVNDIDNDGTEELLFCDRASGASNWHFGVLSVSDIPDDGGGTETWTVEANGLGDIILENTGNKWDIAILNNVFYLFAESGLVYPVKYENNTYTSLPAQSIADTKGSFHSAQVLDIDNDGQDEIVIGGWFSTPPGTVYLLKQQGDTLVSHQIADLSSLGAIRLNGGSYGDLDNDGNVDFVFGSRSGAVPNNSVYRIEYQGGDITSPNNYTSVIIDSLYFQDGCDIDVINIANVDGDPEDEVLYSAAYTRGESDDSLMAIVILDNTGVVPTFSLIVDGQKDDFYNSLTGPADGYLQLRSYAYSSNGRPEGGDADLSVKIWTAWSNEWFYLYEEVTDDIIAATGTNVWEEDEIEIKIDPQPTDSTQNETSVFETRLTALAAGEGVAAADDMDNISAENKQFIRKETENGYVLELAFKWSAVASSNGETLDPVVDNIFGMAINQHDNDGSGRDASVVWAAINLDAVWNTPKYHGTVKFLPDNKLEFVPRNNMTGLTNLTPYDGSDFTSVEQLPTIPTEFSLSQNYPNPFNPSTTIHFAIIESAPVSLTIYNTIGELVYTIIDNELKDAGNYIVNFNASSLASGNYIYVLRQGQQVISKKMMLLK